MENKKPRNIFVSAGLVTLTIVFFKIIGFIKQSVVAYYYGASVSTDAYFIANTFISSINEIVVVSLGVVLLTAYTDCLEKREESESNKFISSVLSAALAFGILAIGFVLVSSPLIASLLLGSNNEIDVHEVTLYIQILSPILLFSLFEMVSSSILDAHRSYFIPRLRSLLYSVAVIVCCVFLSYRLKIGALILSQFSSRIVYTIILIFSISKFAKVRLQIPSFTSDIKNLFKKAFPLFIGNGIVQLNRIIDQSIASRLSEGAVSSLSYSQVLEDFVVATIITNVGYILFANFAQLIASGKNEEVKSVIHKEINVYLCLLVPIGILTIICSKEIVSIVYFRGAFDINALSMTTMALVGYAIAFPIFGIRDLMIKSLYAYKDTLRPMIASVICMAVNVILSIVLSRVLSVFGITLATSISALLGMFITMRMVDNYLPLNIIKEHGKILLKILVASLALTGVALLLKLQGINSSIISFGVTVIIGFAIYITILYFLKVDEIKILINYIKGKFAK